MGRKKMNSNPRRGLYHYRSPAKILWRTIRGLVPHKTARGSAALDRLKSYEGCPHPYDRKKKMVLPACLKVLRLRPERRFCRLGDLSKEVGWKQSDVIDRLESQRKVKSEAFHKKKRQPSKNARRHWPKSRFQLRIRQFWRLRAMIDRLAWATDV